MRKAKFSNTLLVPIMLIALFGLNGYGANEQSDFNKVRRYRESKKLKTSPIIGRQLRALSVV